tara:strand:+ start:685 stop:1383 length:699 start_codon:yes stop_codon:yes gene_type:complete
MSKTISIKFTSFTAFIKRTTRKRSIAIKITPNTVTVLAPQQEPIRNIVNIIEKKLMWIEAQLRKTSLMKPRTFQSKDVFMIKGEPYYLEIIHQHITQVTISKNLIKLSLPKHQDNLVNRRALVANWYQNLAQQIMMPRFAYFQNKLGEVPNKIRFGLRKSRWGSCSSQRNITINWLLAMSPPFVYDYVIVHELCHLKEMNHSEKFWRLVENILPNYQLSRKWLKEHGSTLYF